MKSDEGIFKMLSKSSIIRNQYENVIPINLKQKFKKGSFNCPFFYLENVFLTKNKPNATAGPIPKAKSKVPIPTVPPRYQPIETTVISKKALTAAIGKFVFL